MPTIKKLSLSVLCLSIAFNLHAQSFNFGPKAGANLAWLQHINSHGLLEASQAFHAGAYGKYRFNDHVGLQLEVLYSQQNSDIEHLGGSVTHLFDYINIPLLYTYHFLGGLQLYVGPQIGFLLNAAQIQKITHGTTTEVDVKELYKNIDASLVVGVAQTLLWGISVGMRYNVGLIDIFDTTQTQKLSHQVWQIGISYQLARLTKGSWYVLEHLAL